MSDASTHTVFRDQLLAGRRDFRLRFREELGRSLKSSDLLIDADDLGDSCRPIYYLRSGWACQFQTLNNGRKAIIEVYLPGDVIGLDAALRTRPTQNVIALTSLEIDIMNEEYGLPRLMADRNIALYIAWLLAKRQQRVDRMLTAISSLDARGRLGVMIFDFYKRLYTQKVISSPMYNLPLTQSQIGSYLGLTVVHVNRVLRSLRDDQIVNLEKHCVTILSLEQLAKLAQYNLASRRSDRIARPIANSVAPVGGLELAR